MFVFVFLFLKFRSKHFLLSCFFKASFTFSNFFVDFYFSFFLWLSFPFSLWTFISFCTCCTWEQLWYVMPWTKATWPWIKFFWTLWTIIQVANWVKFLKLFFLPKLARFCQWSTQFRSFLPSFWPRFYIVVLHRGLRNDFYKFFQPIYFIWNFPFLFGIFFQFFLLMHFCK